MVKAYLAMVTALAIIGAFVVLIALQDPPPVVVERVQGESPLRELRRGAAA